jgi:hypothetical protein
MTSPCGVDGTITTAATVLDETFTDAVLIAHRGQLVHERYAPVCARTPHLLMSVSKSLVGCVTGVLAERRAVDPAAAVADYVPEVAGTGYDSVTVRQLLDMRTGVEFREAYTDADAEVRVMERSIGWRPSAARRPDRHLPVPVLAAGQRSARRHVRLPVSRHRLAGLGLRTCVGYPDGGPHLRTALAAARRRVRRRDHL